MTDFSKEELQVIQRTDGQLTILRGGLYLCEVINPPQFNQLLASRFNHNIGLTSGTLRAIADLMDRCEESEEGQS